MKTKLIALHYNKKDSVTNNKTLSTMTPIKILPDDLRGTSHVIINIKIFHPLIIK